MEDQKSLKLPLLLKLLHGKMLPGHPHDHNPARTVFLIQFDQKVADRIIILVRVATKAHLGSQY